METAEDILSQIEGILDALLENAEQLKAISLQVISEGELSALQTKQEDLVHQLNDKQEKFLEASTHGHLDPDLPITKRIVAKLQTFQQLNSQFIENLNSNKGIIHFDKNNQKYKHDS